MVTPAVRGERLARSDPTFREEGRLLTKLGCSNLSLSPSLVPELPAGLERGV